MGVEQNVPVLTLTLLELKQGKAYIASLSFLLVIRAVNTLFVLFILLYEYAFAQ
jgi:hypothetical protein